jgi:HK97 family phage prohead protease
MEDIRYCEAHLEIRAENGQTILEGLASPVYDGSAGTQYQLGDHQIERFAKGAFDEWLATNPEIEIRFNHDDTKVIAVTPTSAKVWSDEKGLHYKAEVDTDISYNKDLVKQVGKKIIRGSSIRFAPQESIWSKEGKMEVRTVTKAMVVECSPVFRPAYKSTACFMRDRDNWIAQEKMIENRKKVQAIIDSISAPSGTKETLTD